ncbi:unnamed protein product [Orchesella dallaii]|uniref:C2H2-type domain-containing protein n=1 Tax=Orchesella dallaii TaxID=48710 RepID=A0ABP1PXF9_9HEXA
MASTSNDLSAIGKREEREQSPSNCKVEWKYDSLWRKYNNRHRESADDWDDDGDDWTHDSYWANYHGKSSKIDNVGTTDRLSEVGNRECSNAVEDQCSTPLFQRELEEESVREVEVMEGTDGVEEEVEDMRVTSSDRDLRRDLKVPLELLFRAIKGQRARLMVAKPRLRSTRLKELEREASELLKKTAERARKAQLRRRLRIAPLVNKKGNQANKTKKDKENSERTCDVCQQVFKKRYDYRVHYRKTHKTHFSRCEICGINYEHPKTSKAHLQKLNVKGECKYKVSGYQGFQCHHCNFRAARMALVHTHMEHCRYEVFTKGWNAMLIWEGDRTGKSRRRWSTLGEFCENFKIKGKGMDIHVT